MKIGFLVGAALLVAQHVAVAGVANSVDLDRCIFKANGKPVPQDECEVMRRIRDEEAGLAQRRAAEMQRLNTAEAVRQQAEADAALRDREARDRLAAEQSARYEARVAANAERLREQDAKARAEEAAAAQAERRQRAACGADYKAPRVGMPVERVRQCVAALKVQGQINRADGIVTTYVSGSGAYFHAMNGIVIAWGR